MDNKENPQFPVTFTEGDSRIRAVNQNLQQVQSGIPSGETSTPAIDVQQKQLDSVNADYSAASVDAANADNSLKHIQDQNKAEASRFLGLRGLFGKDQRKQQESAAVNSSTNASTSMEQTLKAVETQQQNLEAVKAQQSARLGEVIEANLRGGPSAATQEMLSAFGNQDILAKRGKSIEQAALFYKEHIPQIEDRDLMLPMDAIIALKDQITRVRSGSEIKRIQEEIRNYEQAIKGETEALTASGVVDQDNISVTLEQNKNSLNSSQRLLEYTQKKAEENANSEVERIAFIYKTAIKLADELHVEVTQELLVGAIQKGRLLEPNRFSSEGKAKESKTRTRYYEFIQEKISPNEVTPKMKFGVDEYSFCAFLLKGFAEENKLPQDETLIPYALAFMAGANDKYSNVDIVLQRILVDLLPVDTTINKRVDGAWEEEKIHVDPKGLGAQIKISEWDKDTISNVTNDVASGRNTEETAKIAVIHSVDMLRKIAQLGGYRVGINGSRAHLPKNW